MRFILAAKTILIAQLRTSTLLVASMTLMGCTKVEFNPTGNADPVAAAIIAVAGNNQTGTPGQALPTPPAVRVTSADGKPVRDITVIFSASSGGSVVDAVVRTDANGVAAAGKWVLGATSGMQTLSASVPGVASVVFVATASGAPPSGFSRVTVGQRPYGLTVSPNGLVYTSQLDGRSVTRVQFGASTSSGTVAVGATPTDVTFDPTGSLAFVTNQFDPSVGVIDVASGRQTQVIPASATTFRVIVAPDGQRAYATQSDGRLLIINVQTRALLNSISVPSAPNGLAFGSGDTLLYVTSMFGSLAVVNLKTTTVVRTLTLGGTLQDIAVSPDGGTLYVAHEESGVIDVVNASTGTVTARYPVGAGVFGLKLGPDGRTLYATQPSAGQVLLIDRTNGQVSRTFSVGGNPRRVGFDRSTNRAVVSNEAGWLDYLP